MLHHCRGPLDGFFTVRAVSCQALFSRSQDRFSPESQFQLAILTCNVSHLSLPQLSGIRVTALSTSRPTETTDKEARPRMNPLSAMVTSKSAKRKRDPPKPGGRGEPDSRPAQRLRRASDSHLPRADAIKHALLVQYYPSIKTLREYALSKLPESSRLRRKKVAAVGLAVGPPGKVLTDRERAMGHLLDTTLVTFHK